MNGSIRQRSKGTWQMRYEAPPDGTGRRRFLSETIKGSKKDAERALRERLAANENGGYVAGHKETVAQFIERWLKTYVATNTTLRTQQGYRAYIDRYIMPTVGSVKLQDLNSLQVQRIYGDLIDRGLSPTTVNQLHRIFKQALSHAVKWGVLSRNIADATAPPRIHRKQMTMWNVETINKFLTIASSSRFRGFYQLAVLTGLRRSELCGLRWQNVDLVSGKLSVVATLQRIKGHGLVEGLPKTARSRRSVALAPDSIELLHSIRGQQIQHQLEFGELWQNTGYVFTQLDGSPVIPDRVTQDFARLVKREGLPHLTLHGLRHAHATLALTAGVNPKVVSERLGHSTIAVTMDTYSHVLPGMQEAAALVVEELLKQRPAK